MVPDGGVEPSYDEGDGTGSVPTHCSINCGTFSGYDWTMSDEDYTDVFGHGFDEVRDEELDGIAAPSGVMVDLDRLTAQAPAGTESVDVELPEIGEIPAEPGPQATLACPGGGTVRRGQRGWYVPGHGETQIPWTNALEVWGPGEDNRNRPFVVVSDPSGRYKPGMRLGYPEQPPVGSQFETGAVEGPFTWTRHPDGWSIDGTSSWRLSWPAVVKSYGIAEASRFARCGGAVWTRPPAFVMPDVPEIPNLEVKEFGCRRKWERTDVGDRRHSVDATATAENLEHTAAGIRARGGRCARRWPTPMPRWAKPTKAMVAELQGIVQASIAALGAGADQVAACGGRVREVEARL
jgi:hypothetical protein